jgi:transposase
MEENNVFYVGVDVSKAKHAIAIAEGGRNGEVRYFGEIEATPAAVERFVRKLEKKHPRLHFCLYEEGQGGTGVSGQHFFTSSMCCGIHGLSPVA